jgi:hypothetical protein
MSLPLIPIAIEALSFPGAIIFRDDPYSFRVASNVGYEIGIQQARLHKRFANVFCYQNHVMLYFKHDPATISGLYARHSEYLSPSEIAGKHWSKVLILPQTALLASELLTPVQDRSVIA